MKHHLVIALLIAISTVTLPADPPPEVSAQLTEDLISLVKERGKRTPTDAEIAQGVAKMVKDSIARHPSAYEYSIEELQQFKDGRSLYSDENIRAAYSRLKAASNALPMPVLTEFYNRQFEAGKLSSQQKAIFYKLAMAIIIDAEKSKSEQAAPFNR